jgi:peroxiredoxin
MTVRAVGAVADNGGMADEQAAMADGQAAIADGQETTEPAQTSPEATEAARKLKARDLNELIRYTMWSVFRVTDRATLEAGGLGNAAAEVADVLDQAAGKGVVTRGGYDIQGLRADADFMFWWVAPTSDDLQDLYANFRRTRLGRLSEPVWSVMALHRPAEFNKSHIPAFLAGEEPRAYVSVYPFVRSLQWYLLDPAERRKMLAEHGLMAREYPDVRANTVPCFSLNDYEWILAFEADELHRIVDLMRHLRGAEARLHTRAEIPFYTGRRKPIRELIASLA